MTATDRMNEDKSLYYVGDTSWLSDNLKWFDLIIFFFAK